LIFLYQLTFGSYFLRNTRPKRTFSNIKKCFLLREIIKSRQRKNGTSGVIIFSDKGGNKIERAVLGFSSESIYETGAIDPDYSFNPDSFVTVTFPLDL